MGSIRNTNKRHEKALAGVEISGVLYHQFPCYEEFQAWEIWDHGKELWDHECLMIKGASCFMIWGSLHVPVCCIH